MVVGEINLQAIIRYDILGCLYILHPSDNGVLANFRYHPKYLQMDEHTVYKLTRSDQIPLLKSLESFGLRKI
jgi:hypothetical protein